MKKCSLCVLWEYTFNVGFHEMIIKMKTMFVKMILIISCKLNFLCGIKFRVVVFISRLERAIVQ